MLSSPNVYKVNQIVLRDSKARVINSNERMAERIAALSKNLQDSIDGEQQGNFAEEFSDGIEAAQVSRLLEDDGGNVIKAEPVYAGPDPDELLATAREQVEAMLEQAEREAKILKDQAYAEGTSKGHEIGYTKGYQEAEALKKKYEQEYREKEEQLTSFYKQRLEEMEPSLIDTLTDIYEHIFQVKISEQRDVVVHLLENTLRKMEGSTEYLIHVSGDDLPFVSMNREILMEAAGIVNANFDVIEDMTLKKNQCLIETENGIFDCSLGVELRELKKELLLLSYEGRNQTEEK